MKPRLIHCLSAIALTLSACAFDTTGQLSGEDATDALEQAVAATFSTQALYSFESGTQAFSGVSTTATWATDWSSNGTRSLRGSLALNTVGSVRLRWTSNATRPALNFAGASRLRATVRRGGMGTFPTQFQVRLYVKTGSGATEYSDRLATLGTSSTELYLSLAGIPLLNDVRELGVQYIKQNAGTGTGYVYLDNVRLERAPSWQVNGTLSRAPTGSYFLSEVGAGGVTNTYNFNSLTGSKSTTEPALPDAFAADCVYRRETVSAAGTVRSDEYVSVKGNVVRVFEAVSHKLKWAVTLSQLPTTVYGRLSCPSSGTRVYFSTENAIYAVDRSLKTYWRYAPGKWTYFAGTDGATAYATFAFNDSTALVALNASNGAQRWSVRNPNTAAGVSVWLDGSQPYLLNGNTLQQIRKTDGLLGWKYSQFAGSVSAQSIDGAVYAKDLNKLVKLNPADGRVLFTYTTPRASTWVNRVTGWQTTTKAAQDDRVLVSTLEPVENLLLAPNGSVQAADKSNTNAYLFEDQAGYAYKYFDYLKPGAAFPVRALMRIDPLTFAAKWSKPYELSVLGSIFHTTTRVIYLTRVEVGPQPMTTVIALHRETGAELWRKSLNASGSFVAADDHRVYFAASAPSAYGTTLVSYGISKITP